MKKYEKENFIGTTRTTIRPSDDGGKFGYNVQTYGSGRKNQQLDATSMYRDIVRLSYDDDGRTKYDERMKPAIDRYVNTPSIRFIKKHKTGKQVVNLLSDKERDILLKHLNDTAKKHTNDAQSAHKLTATNTYYC